MSEVLNVFNPFSVVVGDEFLIDKHFKRDYSYCLTMYMSNDERSESYFIEKIAYDLNVITERSGENLIEAIVRKLRNISFLIIIEGNHHCRFVNSLFFYFQGLTSENQRVVLAKSSCYSDVDMDINGSYGKMNFDYQLVLDADQGKIVKNYYWEFCSSISKFSNQSFLVLTILTSTWPIKITEEEFAYLFPPEIRNEVEKEMKTIHINLNNQNITRTVIIGLTQMIMNSKSNFLKICERIFDFFKFYYSYSINVNYEFYVMYKVDYFIDFLQKMEIDDIATRKLRMKLLLLKACIKLNRGESATEELNFELSDDSSIEEDRLFFKMRNLYVLNKADLIVESFYKCENFFLMQNNILKRSVLCLILFNAFDCLGQINSSLINEMENCLNFVDDVKIKIYICKQLILYNASINRRRTVQLFEIIMGLSKDEPNDPSIIEAIYYFANYSYCNGNYDLALSKYKSIINKNNAESLSDIREDCFKKVGEIYLKMGLIKKAREFFINGKFKKLFLDTHIGITEGNELEVEYGKLEKNPDVLLSISKCKKDPFERLDILERCVEMAEDGDTKSICMMEKKLLYLKLSKLGEYSDLMKVKRRNDFPSEVKYDMADALFFSFLGIKDKTYELVNRKFKSFEKFEEYNKKYLVEYYIYKALIELNFDNIVKAKLVLFEIKKIYEQLEEYEKYEYFGIINLLITISSFSSDKILKRDIHNAKKFLEGDFLYCDITDVIETAIFDKENLESFLIAYETKHQVNIMYFLTCKFLLRYHFCNLNIEMIELLSKRIPQIYAKLIEFNLTSLVTNINIPTIIAACSNNLRAISTNDGILDLLTKLTGSNSFIKINKPFSAANKSFEFDENNCGCVFSIKKIKKVNNQFLSESGIFLIDGNNVINLETTRITVEK